MTTRLYENGAEFSGEIVKEMSPLLGIFLKWLLPMGLFTLIGQFGFNKMSKKMGGPNSMMFNTGKSNANIDFILSVCSYGNRNKI